jgi:alkylhydroperoxidase family enzyme
VTLRASQINGCSVRVNVHVGMHSHEMRATASRRSFTVSAWREMPYHSEAERRAGVGGGRDVRADR